MAEFLERFPNRLDVLELETPDLAGLLLEHMHSIQDLCERNAFMNTRCIRGDHLVPPGERRQEVAQALIEAWCWLIHEGLIAPVPFKPDSEVYDFTRRGLQLRDRSQFAEYRRRLTCPKELLHETLIKKAWPIFLRGEYDTAIFQAFKEVEVAVRMAGAYGDADFGKGLMRKAFSPTNEGTTGPLSNSTEPLEEQKSLQELFAGAYGRARNPTAHRHGVLSDPTETFEMLILASHLLRIVDRRRPT